MQLNNYFTVLVVIFAIGFDNAKSHQIDYVNSSDLIDSLLSGYDKRFRPNYGGAPVNVEVSMYVLFFESLSDSNMDYTINLYFRQYWNDPRLAFHRSGVAGLTFGHEFSKLIWLPDTFFVNEKQGFVHSITAKNELIKVRNTGDVMRSVRFSITASCPMNYQKFPMDTQRCPLSIESYGYTASEIRYVWKGENAVGVSTESTLPFFKLTSYSQKSQFIQLTTGNYSRLNVEFEMKRVTSMYLPQVYVPCTMLVILSWISFWLNRRAAHIRLAICTLTMLLMPICLLIISSQLPKTGYIKAIDVYTGTCMTFVFVALVEFAFISNNASDKDGISSQIDKIFRYGYATLYVVFNITYWLAY